MTEEEKRTLFFRTYTASVLGMLDYAHQRVRTDYRALPELPAACRYPFREEMELIMSAAAVSSGRTTGFSFPIGELTYGEDVYPNHSLFFSPEKLLNRRTAILARSGYGKSNLCKLLVTSLALGTPAGVIVFDLHGEYALGDLHTGTTVGLLDVFLLTPKILLYTRPESQEYLHRVRACFPAARISTLVNLIELPSHVIRNLCPTQEQESKTVQDLPERIDRSRDQWQSLVARITQEQDLGTRNHLIDDLADNLQIPDNQRAVFRRVMRSLIQIHDDEAPRHFLREIHNALREGSLVIMDLSRYSADMALRIVNTTLDYLLYLRQARIDRSGHPVVAILEEAQNFLSQNHVDQDEVAARWAKEGRKYNLGLIYVTQQPGVIAEEIISQTDNFFALHLLGEMDVKALKRANPLYAGYEGFLQREPVAGNAYVYSAPSQAYVLPVRLREFTADGVSFTFNLPSGEFFVECMRRVCANVGRNASDNSTVGRFRIRVHRQVFGEEIRFPGISDRQGNYLGLHFRYARRLLEAAPVLLEMQPGEPSMLPQQGTMSQDPEVSEVTPEDRGIESERYESEDNNVLF